MMRHRAQRLIGGWVLVVLGVAVALGAISVYVGFSDPGSRAAGFLGALTGVVLILWGHSAVERTRLAYLDDRLDALEERVAEMEARTADPTSPREGARGP